MARRQSAIAAYVTYLGIRLVVCVIQALPWNVAFGLADLLAAVGWRLDRRHRTVAEENLRHAFPHLDIVAIGRLTRDTYRHLAVMLMEMIHLPRILHRHNAGRYIDYARAGDYDRVVGWLTSGRPLIVVTGHFGNWEVFSYTAGLLGFRGSAVARRLDNPYLEHFLRTFRQKTGQKILDKNQDYDRIEKALASGGYLGLVGDQDAGPRGLFVDFLGRPASTFKSIALLSLTYSAPVLVVGAARVGAPMRYRIYVEDVILPEEYGAQPDAPRAITQRYSDALARMVCRHPEQYFWVHRRWKHQPKARLAQKAARPPLDADFRAA
jgi:Kdo2-lipid IVA lauroyltransferase/acyltransferase